MAKVLYIKANAKPEGVSRTFKISDSFIEAYKQSHPGDQIMTLDLYKEGIGLLSAEDKNRGKQTASHTEICISVCGCR